MTDELIIDHPYQGELSAGASCQYMYQEGKGSDQLPEGHPEICARQAMMHANPGPTSERHLIETHPHDFVPQEDAPTLCDYSVPMPPPADGFVVCGYPEALHHWADHDRRQAAKRGVGAVVRRADVAQYERPPMPDAARRGPVVTLIDAPVDPLGTMAVIGGIYTGKVRRSKSEVTDDERRQMLDDMQQTVLNGPLESISFTFLIEGVSRAITHQMVRSRFAFFAQESLRFAVAEDWAQEVPLPPSLAQVRDEDPAVGIWRKALNQAEDAYNALVGAGMPAEEARGVLPHAITTRLYWTVSLRTLLAEAGKRTCTQAQFDWRLVFSGVAKALRERASKAKEYYLRAPQAVVTNGYASNVDAWQYRALADLMRPVCYQQGRCGYMASFDRGCKIRSRVDAFEENGIPSTHWHEPIIAIRHRDSPEGKAGEPYEIPGIDPAEWAADPGAARVVDGAMSDEQGN